MYHKNKQFFHISINLICLSLIFSKFHGLNSLDYSVHGEPNSVFTVKNFIEFLENSLNQKVLNYTINPLTTNIHFGALLHKVDVKVNENIDSEEVIYNIST